MTRIRVNRTRMVGNLLVGSALALTALAQNEAPVFVIDTVAGRFDIGDGGPANGALLASPQGLAQGADGTIYVTDRLTIACARSRRRAQSPR